MTAWIIDEKGRGHVLKTNRRNGWNALCDLYERIHEPIEVYGEGAEREPLASVEKWLASTCREVLAY